MRRLWSCRGSNVGVLEWFLLWLLVWFLPLMMMTLPLLTTTRIVRWLLLLLLMRTMALRSGAVF